MSSALLLTKVDDLLCDDHYHLRSDDDCYFIREYTARAGFGFSDTNQRIFNLKKPMDRRGKPEWAYKEGAISLCATELTQTIKANWHMNGWILVPAPPSKTKSHPEHDDRILQIAKKVGMDLSVPVGEVLENVADREPQHVSGAKRDVQAQIANMRFNPSALAIAPKNGVILVDDVLTTGATFVACKTVLQKHLSGIAVVGLFVARRVPQQEDEPDFLEDDD